MLRSHTRIVESRRDRVDRRNLTVLVLAEIGLHAVENADRAHIQGRCGLLGLNASARRLAAD